MRSNDCERCILNPNLFISFNQRVEKNRLNAGELGEKGYRDRMN